MRRENFQKDPLNLIGKVIVFESDQADANNFDWGYDFPKGFKARVKFYEFTKWGKRWEFSLDFSEFLEENRKLWTPNWHDTIDGKLIENLTWEQSPTFWHGPQVTFPADSDLMKLPFTPED